MIAHIKSFTKQHEWLHKFIHFLIMPTFRPRPRWWVRNFLNPIVHKYKNRSFVSKTTRLDVFPFNKFELGCKSTIEDFSCINNGMGDVIIKDQVRVGLSNTVIGPVEIGESTIIAQNVVLSGLNHGYESLDKAPAMQECTTSKIVVGANCWIGANVVIIPGVKLDNHTVVAAGAVVTKSFEGPCVLAGNPAKRIKKYNKLTNEWERC